MDADNAAADNADVDADEAGVDALMELQLVLLLFFLQSLWSLIFHHASDSFILTKNLTKTSRTHVQLYIERLLILLNYAFTFLFTLFTNNLVQYQYKAYYKAWKEIHFGTLPTDCIHAHKYKM